MKSLVTMLSACLALVFQGVCTAAQAVNTSGHCTGMTVTDYITSDSDDHTQSVNFVNLTDGKLSFTTHGTGCVVITFSAPADISDSMGG